MHTVRQVVLGAFDRLFEKAAAKLEIDFSPEELAAARLALEERSEALFRATEGLQIDAVPREVMSAMEQAIEKLSPAQVAGYLASVPLMHQIQESARRITRRAVEQRLLEQFLEQADDRYGGN